MPITLTLNQTSTDRFFGGGPGLGPVLLNHPTQSSMPIDGWKSALFGLPFLAAGLFIEASAFRVVPVHGRQAPTWILAVIGGFFACPGAFLFLHGIIGMVKKAIYNREAAQYAGEPWTIDHHWNREGASFSAFKTMVGRLVAALTWTTFLTPFFWIGFTQRGAAMFAVVASVFGLVGLIFWFRWAQMLAELVRYGNTFLQYDEFPYYLGGTLRARLRAPQHVSVLQELDLTLRCVQEKYVTTGSGRNRSTQVVCYELYKDVLTLNADRLAGLAGGDIPIEFHLPADKSATTLAATPPTYWEIEARGKAPGADYEAYFLVPVYKGN